MRRFLPGRTFAALVTLTLAGCTSYSSVREIRPRFGLIRPGESGSESRRTLLGAWREERRQPLVALGRYLNAAEAASRELARDPANKEAMRDYNFAVARIFAAIRDTKHGPWTEPLRVPADGGEYTISFKRDPRPQWNPSLYKLTPADQFDVRGKYVSERTVRSGLGAPLVAVGREARKDARENFTLPRVYYGVTGMAFFRGRHCILTLEDPLATESVRFDGQVFPLAADFTVPLAVLLSSSNPKKLELTRMLNPEKYQETARIARLQPYDPKKTVVLVIHGLMDSPATWTPLINALRGDEEIRRNYQFWFFSYPSGYPYPYSAAILRNELDGIEAKFRLTKPMVVIGHSMGGCIGRLLLTDSGDKLWMGFFGKPPAAVHLSPEARKLFTETLIFQRRREVGRMIFVAAPLRGSDLARNPLGRIGSALVRSPVTLLKAGRDALKLVTFEGDDLRLKRLPNSVDTLAPNNRFVKTINRIPMSTEVPYHSIVGDRGRGDTPNSSDGVVPYWSSHLDGAQSELIVPSDHAAHQNPQTIAEVARILKLHLREEGGSR